MGLEQIMQVDLKEDTREGEEERYVLTGYEEAKRRIKRSDS